MYYVDQTLPEGALLRDEVPSLSAKITATNALWYSAERPFRCSNPDSLAPRSGTLSAHPTKANASGISYTDTPMQTLVFNKKHHGGLWVEEATANANCFTFAVIYLSHRKEAKTLLTVNSQNTEDYIFLSEQDGTLLFKNDANILEVSTPIEPHNGYALVIGGFSEGQLFLQQNGGDVVTSPAKTLPFSGPADLFIGCRSHRSGILKTLGESRVSDVFFWSGTNHLCEPDAVLQNITKYWREVINGL